MNLKDKTIHQLRGIAQSFGIDASKLFSMDSAQLLQAIELKQVALIPEPAVIPPRPEYDARLMTKPPAKFSQHAELVALLEPHTTAGLHLTFPEPEVWEMSYGKKTDTGSMRVPLRVILKCAEEIMK